MHRCVTQLNKVKPIRAARPRAIIFKKKHQYNVISNHLRYKDQLANSNIQLHIQCFNNSSIGQLRRKQSNILRQRRRHSPSTTNRHKRRRLQRQIRQNNRRHHRGQTRSRCSLVSNHFRHVHNIRRQLILQATRHVHPTNTRRNTRQRLNRPRTCNRHRRRQSKRSNRHHRYRHGRHRCLRTGHRQSSAPLPRPIRRTHMRQHSHNSNRSMRNTRQPNSHPIIMRIIRHRRSTRQRRQSQRSNRHSKSTRHLNTKGTRRLHMQQLQYSKSTLLLDPTRQIFSKIPT